MSKVAPCLNHSSYFRALKRRKWELLRCNVWDDNCLEKCPGQAEKAAGPGVSHSKVVFLFLFFWIKCGCWSKWSGSGVQTEAQARALDLQHPEVKATLQSQNSFRWMNKSTVIAASTWSLKPGAAECSCPDTQGPGRCVKECKKIKPKSKWNSDIGNKELRGSDQECQEVFIKPTTTRIANL